MEAADRLGRAVRPFLRRAVDAGRRRTGRPRSIRLTISYDERGLRIIDRTPRMKPAPPGDPITGAASPGAILAEVRRSDGQVVYRRRLVKPIPQDVEVFDPDSGPHRVATPPARGTFSVVVPAVSDAEVVIDAGPEVHLAQFDVARDAAAPGRRELGRFRLRG
jgi:hypothetical protein